MVRFLQAFTNFMNILICSPLYPPDVEPAAVHVKELAKRLNKGHRVSVLTYGAHPEHIPDVMLFAVEKHLPLVWRVFLYTKKLLTLSRHVEYVYVENGASVELPVLLMSLFTSVSIIFHKGDARANTAAENNVMHGILQKTLALRAKKVIHEELIETPEIIPFLPYPEKEFEAYENFWKHHMQSINEATT